MISDDLGKLLAILVRQPREFPKGHNFVTVEDSELQFGIFNHPEGHSIPRHWHPSFNRSISTTSEVIIVQSGELKVFIYDDSHELVYEEILLEGDVVVLAAGGHGFEVTKDATILEVKQGPYAGNKDKELF
jgi:hypothetical protein